MRDYLPAIPEDEPNAVDAPRGGAGMTRQPPPEKAGGFDFRRYAYTFWRFRWLVLSILLVAGVAAVFIYRTMKPQYVAASTIWIQDNDHQNGPIRSQELLQSYAWVDLINSFTVLEPVIHDLRLYVHPISSGAADALASLEVDDEYRPETYRVAFQDNLVELTAADGEVLERVAPGEVVGSSVGFRWIPGREVLESSRAIEFALVQPRTAATMLRTRLNVVMPQHGRFVRIEYSGDDPQRLARTVNAVAERLVVVAAELKGSQLAELALLLREQLDYAEENLRESEVALENFRVQTITLPTEVATPVVPGLESTRGAAVGNYFQLSMEKEDLRRDREALARAIADAQQRRENMVAAFEVIPSAQGSSELRAALGQLTEKRAELRALRHRYTDEYEPVQRLAGEVEAMETQVVPGLASQVAEELRTREREIDQMMGSASSELRAIPARSTEEARLERRVAINENLYVDLQRRYENARLAAVSNVPDVQILDPAAAPSTPVDDQRPQLILTLLAGALGAAVGLVFLLDRTDRRVRYPNQVTHELGLPILGAVPNISNGSSDSVAAVEAFREIRHAVAEAYGAAGPVTMAVTSPEKGDGKSFVTANLALSFAGMNQQRILLIDGDTRRGSLHRIFNVDRKPGLTDLLSDRSRSLESVLRKTDNDLVTLLPSGSRMSGGPELLASSAFNRLLSEVRGRFDVILVDTPPLAAGVDAYVLGRWMGNVALVIRTGQTHRELAAAKLDLLDRVPLRLLGAILNAVPNSRVYGYYKYGYGYLSNYEAADEPVSAPELTKA